MRHGPRACLRHSSEVAEPIDWRGQMACQPTGHAVPTARVVPFPHNWRVADLRIRQLQNGLFGCQHY